MAAVTIWNLIKRSGGKVLVTAPSNIAADHLASKISQTNLKVIRVLSRTKEKDKTYYSALSVHHRLERPNVDDQLESELAAFMETLRKRRAMCSRDEKTLKKLRKKLFNAIVGQSDVVVTTCVTSADDRLKNIKFEYLLIDEVAQATEPEVIIPLNSFKEIQKLILIGDIQQLSPVIKSRVAAEAGLDQSLFQRLVTIGNSMITNY